jgi:hypothetical protein
VSQYLPNEVIDEQQRAQTPVRAARRFDPRLWLFLSMGLAGILTVALIVTADESYAGIDGMRAIRAFVAEQDGTGTDVGRIPVLGGIAAAIHDVAPMFFAPVPAPANARVEPTVPTESSSRPASSPSPSVRPTAPVVPAAQLPGATTTPSAPTAVPSPTASVAPAPSNSSAPESAPSATPAPTATQAPAAPPSPTPTPSATPAPTLAISTDRGAMAVVDLTDLVPGDSADRTITVQNGGSLTFRYTVSASQTASTRLWTDTKDGLQLTVRTSGGTVLYAGPLSGLGFLAGPATLGPGTSETLRYTFDFPASASNAFQGLIQDLALVFDAVEYP